MHYLINYLASGLKIKFSVLFVFKLEHLSSDFEFTFSKLPNIIHFHICGESFSLMQ